MKVLNRPMFRMGGPIKEGIMSGIQEPKRGRVDGPGSYAGRNFNNPIDRRTPPVLVNMNDKAKAFENIFTTPQVSKQQINQFSTPYNAPNIFTSPEPIKNTTDKFITVEKISPRSKEKSTVEIANPDYIQKYKTVTTARGDRKLPINTIETGKASGKDMPAMLDQSGKMGADNKPRDDDNLPNLEDIKRNDNDGLSRKDKVNSILEGLGYDRAQKNALYDAMIKAGQRISRTGLGADNLVSDVIAETSQSYDKPEKLREAANLMQVQQDLKIDQIKATNEYKKNAYEEKEAYLTGILGDADLAKRISVGSPKNILEAQKTVDNAGITLRSEKGVDATLSIYFDGINVPKYKGPLSEDNTAALVALKGDKPIEEIKGESVDLDDGVYKLGKGYVDIRDGKIFDVREIISSFIEE
jgi:hypothetical protein